MRTIHRLAAAVVILLAGAAAPIMGARAQQTAPAGKFDYYLLTLTWSPAYCATHHRPAAREECAQHRGLIVHGLWPQYENGGWPAFCREVTPVPRARVLRELPSMPNAAMVQHEWEKHGSCTTMTAGAYFDATDKAFAGFHVPERLDKPHRPVTLRLKDAKRIVTEANPGLTEAMFSLRCDPKGHVQELRLCLDRAFHPRLCGKGQEDLCPVTVRFEPVPDSGR
jgi:ribonuclease T2